MESAIPARLKCPRSQPQRKADGWVPPYPAWASNAPIGTDRIAIVYFGVQWRSGTDRTHADATAEEIRLSFALEHGPAFFEKGSFVDALGFDNILFVAYWNAHQSYLDWAGSPSVSQWWSSKERDDSSLGLYREAVSPGIDQFEALFSSHQQTDGAAILLDGQSADMIEEHAYWGSMRDRIPLSQTSPLEPAPDDRLAIDTRTAGRIRTKGHDYIALIRSGQDWRTTSGKEREIYLEQVEPHLNAGMGYLEKSGNTIGCYSNRYVRLVDDANNLVEKSFGLSFWKSLGHLERWAESHETHLAIFNSFLYMAEDLQFKLSLNLYHEVCVLHIDQQDYEYINCHNQTGMLPLKEAI